MSKGMNLHRPVLLSILAVLTISPSLAQGQERFPSTESAARQRQHALRERDGLHLAALENGGNYEVHDIYIPGWVVHRDIPDLVADSDIVVVGILTKEVKGRLNR